LVQQQIGEGAPGMLQVVAPESDVQAAADAAASTDGIAMVTPAMPAADSSGLSMFQAIPDVEPSDGRMGEILTAVRTNVPDTALVGGAPAENRDLQQALNDYFPLVVGIILTLGFILLLMALRAPLIALVGTVVSLLSTAASFGMARLIFQDGLGASVLGFEPQGFLDGWGPVFFFAMIFAIAMDYTVFLPSTCKEHYEISGDPRTASIDGLAHSGRDIAAAAAVMVAVFFTFALADPLPPKEMGIILGVAVLLDAGLVRLILLPVTLRLTGRAAWWSPSWLDKMLPKIPAKTWSRSWRRSPARSIERGSRSSRSGCGTA
ncbi:MAG: MMPL family transporter, partial [Tomitella sp.]|nr:MMPL family transporter [Tomitella sp.]